MWPTIFELNLPFWPHEFEIRSYGLMLMIGFLGGTWWATRRADRVKANAELIVNCGFVALVFAIIGARLFYVIHYWDQHFAGRGLWAAINITSGGLEFYGGLVGAFLALIGYLWWNGVSLRLYFDIIAPSLAFGLAVTRIGCFLNGCCWGGACPPEMAWGVQFPYQSPAFDRQWRDRLVGVPAELIFVSTGGTLAYPINPMVDDPRPGDAIARHAAQFGLQREDLIEEASHFRSIRLHPAQLYAATGAGLLAILLNTAFYRRKRHGVLVVMFMTLYPIMRIFEEIVRVDNPHDTAGLTISQFVSVLLILFGLGYYLMIRRMPLRSPKAVPYVPPWEQEDREVQAKADQPKGGGRAKRANR